MQIVQVESGLEERLSLHQARHYVASIGLRVEPPSVEYLAKICQHTLAHIPFQNFTMLVRPRASPTWEQIIEDMLSGLGGLCTTLNPFLCALLHRLGFKSVLLPCEMQGVADMHMAVGVSISSSFYWLDCGNGFPYFQPIDVNAPVAWCFAGFHYTGRRSEKYLDIVQSVLGSANQICNQRVSLTPVHYSYFDDMRRKHYLDVNFGPFLRGLRLNRWVSNVGYVMRDNLVADLPGRFLRVQQPQTEKWISARFSDQRILHLYRDAEKVLSTK
jgi:hypothetical protein